MLVRNTVSGVVVDLPAEKSIGHPWFGRFYKPVAKPKNEVLSQPHEVDENGERKALEVKTDDSIAEVDAAPVEDAKPAGDVKPTAPKKAEDR